MPKMISDVVPKRHKSENTLKAREQNEGISYESKYYYYR